MTRGLLTVLWRGNCNHELGSARHPWASGHFRVPTARHKLKSDHKIET